MKNAWRGIAIAAVHCLLVLSVAGKYAWDRERLPRAWANATPIDPNLPIRGRYVTLQLRVETAGTLAPGGTARLAAENGRLVARPAASGGQGVWQRMPDLLVLTEPVAFFLPEHAADPSLLSPGQELWVEVSVPANGPPRPLRLGIKKDGELKPLDLR
jgi:hypothetical protein